MKLRWWTAAVIMFSVISILAWDVFAFTTGGIEATVSDVLSAYIGQAQAKTVPSFACGFVAGGLFVHFFGWTMEKPK